MGLLNCKFDDMGLVGYLLMDGGHVSGEGRGVTYGDCVGFGFFGFGAGFRLLFG